MPGRESSSNVAIALVDEGAFGLKTESVEELEHFEDLLVWDILMTPTPKRARWTRGSTNLMEAS